MSVYIYIAFVCTYDYVQCCEDTFSVKLCHIDYYYYYYSLMQVWRCGGGCLSTRPTRQYQKTNKTQLTVFTSVWSAPSPALLAPLFNWAERGVSSRDDDFCQAGMMGDVVGGGGNCRLHTNIIRMALKCAVLTLTVCSLPCKLSLTCMLMLQPCNARNTFYASKPHDTE